VEAAPSVEHDSTEPELERRHAASDAPSAPVRRPRRSDL